MSDTQLEYLLSRLTTRETKAVQKEIRATEKSDLMAVWDLLSSGKIAAIKEQFGKRANPLRHQIRKLVLQVLVEGDDQGGLAEALQQLHIARILLQREAFTLGEKALRKAKKIASEGHLHECLLMAHRLEWQYHTARLQRRTLETKQASLDAFLNERLQPLRQLEELAQQEWLNSALHLCFTSGTDQLPEMATELLEKDLGTNFRALERQQHAVQLYQHLNGTPGNLADFISGLLELATAHPKVFADRPDLVPLLRRSWLLEQVKEKSPENFVQQVEAMGLLESIPGANQSLRLRQLNFLTFSNYLEALLHLRDEARIAEFMPACRKMMQQNHRELLPFYRFMFFALLTMLLIKDYPAVQRALRKLKPVFEDHEFNPASKLGFQMVQVLALLEQEEFHLANSIARSMHYQLKKIHPDEDTQEMKLLASLIYYAKEGFFVPVGEYLRDKFPHHCTDPFSSRSYIEISVTNFLHYRVEKH